VRELPGWRLHHSGVRVTMSARPAFIVYVRDRNGLPLNGVKIEFTVNGQGGFKVPVAEGRASIENLKPDDVLGISATYDGDTQTASPSKDAQNWEFKFDVDPNPQPSLKHAIGYAALSLVFLGVAILVGRWVLLRATALGPNFQLAYYGAVVILGLSAALVLFGCLRSYAHLKGKQGGIEWELGGAAALFAMVVIGAFVLARPESTFELAIRLKGAGVDADALRDLTVTVDLGLRRDPRPFNSLGEAIVPRVPATLINTEVPVFLSPGRVHLKNPDQGMLIPPERVVYLDVTVDDPRVVVARENIAEIRKLVRMTLISQNETLTPAFEKFRSSPTKENWFAVQTAATKLLGIVERGTRAALEYDASFGPAVAEIESVAHTEGAALIGKPFTLVEQRRQWNGRAYVLRQVVRTGPPTVQQADAWMADLKEIYEKLEATLQSVEVRLADAGGGVVPH
jgi:hypothetical protein